MERFLRDFLGIRPNPIQTGGNVFENIGKGLSDAANNVGKFVGDATEVVQNKAQDVLNNTSDFFNKEVTETIKGKNKKSNSSQIVQYSVPQAIQSGSHEKELGKENNNFTSYNRNLNYSDYRDAYSIHNVINVGKVNKKEYVDLEDLENERKTDTLELPDEIKDAISKDIENDQKNEKNRQNNVREFDHHLQIH